MIIYASSSQRKTEGESPSNFSVHFPLGLFDSQHLYTIELLQAIIPYTWYQILDGDFFNLVVGSTTHKVTYGISGNYTVLDIATHLKSRLNLFSLGFTWTVSYNKNMNLFTFTHTDISNTPISFNFIGAEIPQARSLFRFMGFQYNATYLFPPSKVLTSEIPCQLNDEFIQMKLVGINHDSENRPVNVDELGAHYTSKFLRIPIIGQYYGSLVWQSIDNSNRLHVRNLQDIKIELLDSRGNNLVYKNDWNLTFRIVKEEIHAATVSLSDHFAKIELQNDEIVELLSLLVIEKRHSQTKK